MFCQSCGNPLVPGPLFCGKCGAKIAAPSPSSAHVGPTPSRSTFRLVGWIVAVFVLITAVFAVWFNLAGPSISGIWASTNSQLAEAANRATQDAVKIPEAAAKANGCFYYDSPEVRLTGVITQKEFPGPPNYESVEKGDEPEDEWILNVAVPFCVNEDSADQYDQAEANIKESQLLLSKQEYDRYRSMIGKMVAVTGGLSHAMTAHHHTTIMLAVKNIEVR
jgi:hypothetical protein